MPIFYLTSENIDFTKCVLRSTLQGCKSSHLSEAVAAALGFRTNAALLKNLYEAQYPRPLLCKVSSKRFGNRLRELGSPIEDCSTLDKIVRSSDLPLRAWIDSREMDRYKRDQWFRECTDRDIPYVHVVQYEKYATLNWDCVSIQSREGEAHVREELGRLMLDILWTQCQSIAKCQTAKWEFFGSAFVGTVKGLGPAIAHLMADAFFYELYMPMLIHAPWQRKVRK